MPCRVWSHLIILDPLMRQTPSGYQSLLSVTCEPQTETQEETDCVLCEDEEVVVVDVGSLSAREEVAGAYMRRPGLPGVWFGYP